MKPHGIDKKEQSQFHNIFRDIESRVAEKERAEKNSGRTERQAPYFYSSQPVTNRQNRKENDHFIREQLFHPIFAFNSNPERNEASSILRKSFKTP